MQDGITIWNVKWPTTSDTRSQFSSISFEAITHPPINDIYTSLYIVAPLLSLILTDLPLDKTAAILQSIFSNAFSWMKSFLFWLKFQSLFLGVQLI